ncbi:MAG: DNA-binding transcriptional regulator [Burkholderiaceae bacterium]
MGSFPPVESVVRAVRLLQALNGQPVSTLDLLHRQTGIPKPSLVRLLQTLAGLGLVRHAPQHGAYYLTSQVRSLSSGYHSEPRAVEAAAPILDELTERIKWPLALAVHDGDAVVVRYSTIPKSPLSLLHSTLNRRLSLVSRALGRAYLAFCEPDEADAIIRALQASDDPEDRPARDLDSLREVLAGIRAQGYASREPSVRPVSNTLAVPVMDGGRVFAAIGMTFFSSTMSVDEAVRRHLGDLREASAQITAALRQLDAQAGASLPPLAPHAACAPDSVPPGPPASEL